MTMTNTIEKKYSIFHLQGGIGKHIAATAIAQAIKANHPDRKLIVVCAYPDIFINLPYVHRVYTIGNTQYFYQEYVQGKDSILNVRFMRAASQTVDNQNDGRVVDWLP